MKISDFIGETTEYEKKVALEVKKPKSWLKSVSAFANGSGGVLIFGVDDNEKLVGLKDAKHVSESISEFIKTRLDPIPQIIMENRTEEGKIFIMLKVLAGAETPYYYIGDGNRTAFIRVGNESVPVGAIDLKRLVIRGDSKTFDSVSSKFPFDKYTFSKFRSVYRQELGKDLDLEDFISFGLIDENGMLTNAGALLADEAPLKNSRLFCTRWFGTDKAAGIVDAIDDKEFRDSLVALLQSGIEFVKSNSKVRWKKTATGRDVMPEYPERAVLEGIVNALIHRDYLELGSEVHIDMYDDRLEIYSPGGMKDGTCVQNLDTDKVPSLRRNPIIADIFNRMNYMERRGSGLKKIMGDYHKEINFNEKLEPEFYSDNKSFWVTLYNLNFDVPLQDSKNEKLDFEPQKLDFEPQKLDFEPQKLDFEPQKLDFEPQKLDFEPQKLDFEPQKLDFEPQKLDFTQIEVEIVNLNFNLPTKEKIKSLYSYYGNQSVFSRTDVCEKVDVSKSRASALIKKLYNLGVLEKAEGEGRGKYRFKV